VRRFSFVLALLAVLVVTPQASAWSWPLRGDVLRPYSLGPDPYAGGQHRGVDVAGSAGEAVRAPAAGVVSFVGVVPSSGRTVTIQTDGYAVSLTHLGETTVAKGATVAEGDAVGVAGQSGEVEWPTPYVHLGIRVSSAADGYVDPATLLPPREVAPPPTAEAPVVAPSPAPVVPRWRAPLRRRSRRPLLELLRARPWARERPLHQPRTQRRPASPHRGMRPRPRAPRARRRRRLRTRRAGRTPAQHGRQEQPERQQFSRARGSVAGARSRRPSGKRRERERSPAPVLCPASRASRPAPAT